MKKYKALVISPYEGFSGIVRNVMDDYKEFDLFDLDIEMLTLPFVEDFLRRTNLSGYDVVISRGQSAVVAETVLAGSIPVVNIGFSPYDILRSLKLAMNGPGSKIAFLVFANIRNSVMTLFELIGGNESVELSVHTAFQSEEEMEECIVRLHDQEGVTLFVGDGVCNRLARAHEFDNILVTSGAESIAEALQRALLLCGEKERGENQQNVLENILRKSSVPIAIYNKQGNILCSNLHSAGPEYSELDLKDLVERSLRHPESKYMVSAGRQSFRVRANWVEYQGEEYVLFYVAPSFPNNAKNRQLYDTVSRADVQDCLVYMVNSPTLSSMLEKVTASSQSKLPVFVYGKRSSGKSTFLKAVYATSQYSRNPLVVIDCLRLNDELLTRLFEDERSVLLEQDFAVYFKNIHALSMELQNKLEYYLGISNLAARHKLLTSFTGDLKTALARNTFSSGLYHCLAGISLPFPSITERSLDIPNIIRIFLNQINQKLPVQIASIDQEAMGLLRDFPWTNGIDQLYSTIQELALASDSQVIRGSQVARFLTTIRNQPEKPARAQDSPALDLSRTLDEIEQEIIEIVFREENMNQTKAAQRLGISRTSLWKKLNRSKVKE